MFDTNSSSVGSFRAATTIANFHWHYLGLVATTFELRTMPTTNSSFEGIVGASIMAARGR
jgi:hypothetical protein